MEETCVPLGAQEIAYSTFMQQILSGDTFEKFPFLK